MEVESRPQGRARGGTPPASYRSVKKGNKNTNIKSIMVNRVVSLAASGGGRGKSTASCQEAKLILMELCRDPHGSETQRGSVRTERGKHRVAPVHPVTAYMLPWQQRPERPAVTTLRVGGVPTCRAEGDQQWLASNIQCLALARLATLLSSDTPVSAS